MNKKGKPPEWIPGFVSGVLATLLGFGLAVLWDAVKDRRDAAKREQAVLAIVRDDIFQNYLVSTQNEKILTSEISSLGEKEVVLMPIYEFRETFWDTVRGAVPHKIEINATLKQNLRLSELFARQMNSKIQYREHFVNEETSISYNRVESIDRNILELNSRLKHLFMQILPELPKPPNITATISPSPTPQ